MTREEAIKLVKSVTVYTPEEMEALKTLIPELSESEDEIIPQLLHNLLCAEVTAGQFEKHCLTVDSALSWLEKQMEKSEKPIIPEQEPNPSANSIADWSAFHREAAKDILCAIVANNSLVYCRDRIAASITAIAFADELTKQLKEQYQ